MESLRVRDLMTDKVIVITENEDLATAHDRMFENHVRHLPVVDDERAVIGIVTYQDLVGLALNRGEDLSTEEMQNRLRATPVKTAMKTPVATVDGDEKAEKAGRILLETRYSCLPVTCGTKLIGVLTESDYVRHVVEQMESSSTANIAKPDENGILAGEKFTLV